MVTELLASTDSAAYQLGRVIGALLIPGAGLVMLIVGLRMRSRRTPMPQQWVSPPPGYPPVPGQPGPYPGYPSPGGQASPYPSYPPPPPKQTGGTVLIVLGAILLVLGLLGLLVNVAVGAGRKQDQSRSTTTSARTTPSAAKPSGLSVGDCITNAQYQAADMDPDPVACGTSEAIYELAYRGEGSASTCPDGLREESNYAVLLNKSHLYCFVLDVSAGECFEVDPDKKSFTSVACTDPTANAKVDQVIEGKTDLAACPGGPTGAAFPEPPHVVCTVQP